MKILKWLFGKKNKESNEFRVRVVYAFSGKYYVDYYNNGWKRIKYWFGSEIMHPKSGLEGFFENLFDVHKAEQLANSLKSMDDVMNYYIPIIEEKKKWESDEKEFWIKNVPYKEKTFK